jgi:hypothetical protein
MPPDSESTPPAYATDAQASATEDAVKTAEPKGRSRPDGRNASSVTAGAPGTAMPTKLCLARRCDAHLLCSTWRGGARRDGGGGPSL